MGCSALVCASTQKFDVVLGKFAALRGHLVPLFICARTVSLSVCCVRRQPCVATSLGFHVCEDSQELLFVQPHYQPH